MKAKKILIAILTLTLMVTSIVAPATTASAATSNGTLQVAFNTNVKSITVTYNGSSTTYTSQSYVQVPIGVTVTWTATCASGYAIKGGSNSGSFTMTSYYQLAPTAEKITTYPLSITFNSNVASISVTMNGTTTRYTSSTVVNVNSGTAVSWTATAATGYNLSASSGSFTMTTASSIAPTASIKTFAITVTVNTGVDYIRVNGTRYDSSTTLSFNYGNSVSWEASPKTGYTLSQTSGSFTMTNASTIAPITNVKSFTISVASYTPSNADAQFSWKLEWASGKSLTGAVSDYVTMTVASDGKSVTLTFVKDFSAGEMVLTCYATADPTVKATCTVKCGS